MSEVDLDTSKYFEPNKSGNGKVASNKTGVPIKLPFDYGEITERDKKLIKEVVDIIKTYSNESSPEYLTKQIIEKFEIEEIPMKDYKQSLFWQFFGQEKLGVSMQGYREIRDENGKKVRIPHLAMSSDLDYLDEMTERFILKVKNLKFPD
jgi:hypothetical protein